MTDSNTPDPAAVAALGTMGFAVRDPEAWHAFLTQVLGLMPAGTSPAGARLYRLDDQAWRIAVQPGEADDLVFAGFEVADAAALERVAERLRRHGVAVDAAPEELRRERDVLGLVTCRDPDGLAIEIHYGALQYTEHPFVSPVGIDRFVTGDQGAGHIVLAARDMAAMRAFYSEALGFALSDIITMAIGPTMAIDLEFYHCNPRHHTLALAPAPGTRRLHHFMVEVPTIDDVGFALDRAVAAGARVVQGLGRHTNDRMISFYVATPSGIQVEYGHGARQVDRADWRVARHGRISMWGHAFAP
jgi:2,3-dihydroxybiphenyl 1,2-dioxygenase